MFKFVITQFMFLQRCKFTLVTFEYLLIWNGYSHGFKYILYNI